MKYADTTIQVDVTVEFEDGSTIEVDASARDTLDMDNLEEDLCTDIDELLDEVNSDIVSKINDQILRWKQSEPTWEQSDETTDPDIPRGLEDPEAKRT